MYQYDTSKRSWLYKMIKIILLGLVMVCLADNEDDSFAMELFDYENNDVIPYEIPKTRLGTVSEKKCEQYISNLVTLKDSRRIYDGKDADIGQFPFMGAVGWRLKNPTGTEEFVFKCGSTLISEKFLMTTALCTDFFNFEWENLTSSEPKVVMLGVENIREKGTEERRPKIVEISNIILHPEYTSRKRYHCIALLEAENTIEFTKFIYPACLWSYNDVDLAGQKATISGWGLTKPTQYSLVAHLQYGEVDIIENSICDNIISYDRKWQGFTYGEICAGKLPNGGVDTCQGDSGGPLIYYRLPEGYSLKFFPSVIGVTNFGANCGLPSVYTRVSQYIHWIEEHVWNRPSPSFSSETDESTFSYLADDVEVKKIEYDDPVLSRFKTVSEKKCEQYILNYIFLKQNPRRIHSGKDAEIGQFPFMGAVGWRSNDSTVEWKFKCGSTLISDRFLLTAAHCTNIGQLIGTGVASLFPEVVLLGVENVLDIGTEERRPEIVKILNIIVHPEYHSPKKYHDIALLKTEHKIEFTKFINPACLWPHEDINLIGRKAIVSGWGVTKSGEMTAHLQYGEVDIIENSLCDKLLEDAKIRNWRGFVDGQMCAGILEGGVDTCKGDSGGPLLYYGLPERHSLKEFPSVVGITSFGKTCGRAKQPSLYTRVSHYIDWIEEHVWNRNGEGTRNVPNIIQI